MQNCVSAANPTDEQISQNAVNIDAVNTWLPLPALPLPRPQASTNPINRLGGQSSISLTTTYTELRDVIDGPLYTHLLVIDIARFIYVYKYLWIYDKAMDKCMIDSRLKYIGSGSAATLMTGSGSE